MRFYDNFQKKRFYGGFQAASELKLLDRFVFVIFADIITNLISNKSLEIPILSVPKSVLVSYKKSTGKKSINENPLCLTILNSVQKQYKMPTASSH